MQSTLSASWQDSLGHRSVSPKQIFATLAVYLIWGSTYLAQHEAIKVVPPSLMNGSRFIVAGLAIYVFLRLRGWQNPKSKQIRNAVLVGVILNCASVGLLGYSLKYISSGLAALGIAAIPLWAALFNSIWERRPRPIEALGLGLGIVGVAILNVGNDLWVVPAGAIALLISPAIWAFGSVYSRRLELPSGLMSSAFLLMGGGVSLTLVGLMTGERISEIPNSGVILGWFYLAVFGSIIAFSAYTYLLQNAPPIVATSYAYVNPIIAVILGAIFAHESLTWQTLIAGTFIIAAVVIITFNQRPRHPKSRVLPSKVIA